MAYLILMVLIAQKFPTHLAAKVAGRISQVVRRRPNQLEVRNELEMVPVERHTQTHIEQKIIHFKNRMRGQSWKKLKEGKNATKESDLELTLLQTRMEKAN